MESIAPIVLTPEVERAATSPPQPKLSVLEADVRINLNRELQALQEEGHDRAAIEKPIVDIIDDGMRFEHAVAAIDANPDLSEEGKGKAKRAAAEKFFSFLAPLEKLARDHRETEEGNQKGLLQAGTIQRPADVDPQDWERRLARVREQAQHLDPLERFLLYVDAVEQNDPEVLAALETAGPVLFERPDPKDITKKVRSWRPFLDTVHFSELTERRHTGETKRSFDVRANRVLRGEKLQPEWAKTRDHAARMAKFYENVVADFKRSVLRQANR